MTEAPYEILTISQVGGVRIVEDMAHIFPIVLAIAEVEESGREVPTPSQEYVRVTLGERTYWGTPLIHTSPDGDKKMGFNVVVDDHGTGTYDIYYIFAMRSGSRWKLHPKLAKITMKPHTTEPATEIIAARVFDE